METMMRPPLTFILLVAVFLASPSANNWAQNTDEKPVEERESASTVNALEPPKPLTKEEQAEARRLAREERAREQVRERAERERQCIIKPVMTDAEIAFCKEVWR
jgi:hypothetical protein